LDEGIVGSLTVSRIEIIRARFDTSEVVGEENRMENLGQERYRSLGKMLQGPVRDTVWG
jgi:hypothetical protein